MKPTASNPLLDMASAHSSINDQAEQLFSTTGDEENAHAKKSCTCNIWKIAPATFCSPNENIKIPAVFPMFQKIAPATFRIIAGATFFLACVACKQKFARVAFIGRPCNFLNGRRMKIHTKDSHDIIRVFLALPSIAM